MIFPNLHIFLLFVIFIINPPISDDGDFVCCHIISEMQHALETRLPYYKQSYEYLLNSRDLMVMMKAVPFKVECYNKISPLLHPYFYNTNTFNASFKCNLILPITWMSCNCFGCVVAYLTYVNLDVSRTLSNIQDGYFLQKQLANRLYQLAIFPKKVPSKMGDRALNAALNYKYHIIIYNSLSQCSS